MRTLKVTDKVTLYGDGSQRAVVVRGNDYISVVDLPNDRLSAQEILSDPALTTPEGLHTAILTLERVGEALPYDILSGVCVVRADRTPMRLPSYNMVPSHLLRYPDVRVSLVRGQKEIEDDAGHRFHMETCAGIPHALSVLIKPENVLVTCDDLAPGLPPRIYPGALHDTLSRLHRWQSESYSAIIPKSGDLIRQALISPTLQTSISYLEALYRRMMESAVEARYPWEHWMMTIPWCDVWDADMATPLVVERHQANIRDIAMDVWRNGKRRSAVYLPGVIAL